MTQVLTVAIGPSMGIRARLVSGVFWTMVVAVAAQGSSLLSSIISARVLGREDYGRLAMLLSLVVTLTNFAGLGLGLTVTKFISEFRGQSPDRAGRMLGMCSLVTAATGLVYAATLVALAPWIATVFLKSPELVNEIRLCSIAVLFMTMNGYQAGALQGMETFSALARIAVIMGPITIALTLALSWSFHLPGGAMATGIVAMLSWGLHQIMLRRETRRRNIRIRYDHLRRELPLLRGFALPAAISAIVGGIAITGASAAVARQPGGFAELAVFSAANTLRTIALFMPSLVSRVSMPVLCNLQATRDARYQRTLWTCLVFNAGLTAVSAVVLYSLAPLALWMFGRGFVASRTMPALLLASAVAETIAVGWYQVICSHGKMWTQLAICCLWSCVLLGGTMWSVETGGAAALAGAYLAAWTLAAALYAAASRRLLQNGSFSSPTCRN